MSLKSFILITCSMCSLIVYKPIKQLNSDAYDSFKYEEPLTFAVEDFSIEIENDGLISGSATMHVFNTSTVSYIDLLYIFDNQDEKSYKRVEVHKQITIDNKKYTYNFNMKLDNTVSKVKYNFSFTMPLVRQKLELKFAIDNPNKKIITSSSKKIYYGYSYSNLEGKNYYYLFNPTSLLKAPKRIFYYDYFSFENCLIKSNIVKAFDEAYFYINPRYKHLLRIFNLTNPDDKENKYIRLSVIKSSNFSQIKFKNKYFYNPITNITYLKNSENYRPTGNKIYMPIKYYDLYKNFEIGLFIKSFSPKGYDIYFNHKVFFEKNYKKDVGIIYKEITKITEDDEMELIKI